MSRWSILKERVAGKWQIPLLGISLVMLTCSFLRLRPDPTTQPLDKTIEYVNTLVSGEFYDRAIEIGTLLIESEECSDAELAPIHLQLARAWFGRARLSRMETLSAGARIVEHYGAAWSQGVEPSAVDLERAGRALEWQAKIEPALEYFQKAIQAGINHRSDLRRHMITLRQTKPGTSPDVISEMVDALLAELEDHRLDLRLWALEQKLGLLEELGRLDEAATLLVSNQDRFLGSDLQDHFNYLEGLLLYKTGHFDEAEAHLRTIRNRLDYVDEIHAKTGWLLGRVVMSDGGPQRPLEAVSFFNDVLTHNPGSAYAAASRVGMAEALGYLERHEEAIDAYRAAIEDMEHLDTGELMNRDVLRTSLAVTAETQRQQGHIKASLDYINLAVRLLDRSDVEESTRLLLQLAQIQSARAEQVNSEAREARGREGLDADQRPADVRVLFAEAAATHVELARINTPDERRAAESTWRAAELYSKAGEYDRAIGIYSAFAQERPAHPRVPRALLRIGQLHERMGRLEAAIDAYQECYGRFPRTLDGVRALVPLGRCYLGLGPDQEELAEKTLRVVLEDSAVFTPQAPEFASALFMLGDVLNRRGSYEQAIAKLEEAIDRYPSDARVWRARFLLADSYRRSGLALKEEMAETDLGGELRQMEAESVARFGRARELYRELIAEYGQRTPSELNRLEETYLRHAHLYLADCYFETQDYREALRRYEAAAGTFKDAPTGLSAYVQMINCHVFLGQPREARAALARALILVDTIPQEAFDKSVSLERRKDWKRYFQWLDQAELF